MKGQAKPPRAKNQATLLVSRFVKLKNMKSTFFSILLFSCSIGIFKAQTDLVFEMKVVSKQLIGAIEPLVYELTLKNRFAVDTQAVQVPWNNTYRPIIEFRRRGQLKWEFIPGSELRAGYLYSVNWSPPSPLKEERIMGEQVFREEFVLSPNYWGRYFKKLPF